MQLMMRGKTWHLRRRVPARFASVEPRREVWVSLKSDSRQQATKKAPAVLGTVEVPSMTVFEALAEYWALTPYRVRGKSADQKRRWENPRKKAVRNFIDVVGDRPVAALTRADFLDFRSWWLERIAEENLTPNSANKDLIHLSNVLRTVDELKGLGLDLPMHKLTLKEGDKAERIPFSDDWIREKLLAEGALSGLNDEARAILVGMINTVDLPCKSGEHQLRNQEVFHGKRKQADTGVSA